MCVQGGKGRKKRMNSVIFSVVVSSLFAYKKNIFL